MTLEMTAGQPSRKLVDAFNVLQPQESWKPSTISEYRAVVRRWQEFHEGPGPDVQHITEEMLLEFVQSVKSWASYSTRIKQLLMIQKILKAVAPRQARSRYGMRKADSWLEELPYPRLPKPPKPTTIQTCYQEPLTVADIGKLYVAAEQLDEPIRWRTMLVLAWVYGPRRSDLLLMPWDAIGKDQTLCYRETKGGNQVGPLPLTDYVIAHLCQCRKQQWAGSILGFTYEELRNRGTRIYAIVYELYRLAGVEVLKNSGGKRVPFHGLRSACITNWTDHAPGLQRPVVGHQTKDVSDNHYRRTGRIIKEKIITLPIPHVFNTYM